MPLASSALHTTRVGRAPARQGKVRDLYHLDDVVAKTREKYLEAFTGLAGLELQ